MTLTSPNPEVTMKERAEKAQAYFINGLAKVESEATKRNPLTPGEIELNENIRVMLAYIAALEAEVARLKDILDPFKGRREAFADSQLGLDAHIAVDDALTGPDGKGVGK